MRNMVCLVFALVLLQTGYSQFVNNGATVTIQAGATLKVESNFINENAGSFTNNGVLEVTGNFTNSATFTSGANSEVVFSGNANSTVTPGTAQFQDVTLAKTNANIVLAGNMTVNGVLDFSTANNKVVLGNHNLTMGATGTVTNAGSDRYVVATGSGRMIKPISANGTLVFELGDAAVNTNYSPLSCEVTGTSYTSASLGVNLVNAVHPNKPATSNDFITRYWDVLASGINDYSNTITGTYVSGDDLNGTQSNIKGAVWNGANWSYTNSSGTGNTITVNTTVLDAEITGFGRDVTLNAKVFLTNVNSGTMSDVLRTLSNFPLTDVYTTAPYSTSGLFTYVPAQSPATTTQTVLNNNNVVDWVFVELRTGSSGSTTVAASKSGLLKNDGTIINPDGSPFSFPGVTAGSYKIAIKHRNHCGFMTNDAVALPNASLLNLTNNTVSLYEPSHPALQLKGTGEYAMWTGDAVVNGAITGGDVNFIRSQSGISSGEYNRGDVNLNGSVTGGDVNAARVNSGVRFWQID